MAILKRTKKDDSAAVEATKEVAAIDTKAVFAPSFHATIKRPRVTEKAAIISGNNVYTFEVEQKATKVDIARAIKEIYKVDPVRVSVSRLPAKKKTVRGKRGMTSAIKKAMVYLKKGDTIEFV